MSATAIATFTDITLWMAAVGPLDVERLVTTAPRYGCEIAGSTLKRRPVESAGGGDDAVYEVSSLESASAQLTRAR